MVQRSNDIRGKAQLSIPIVLRTPLINTTVSGQKVAVLAEVNVPVGHHGIQFIVDGVSVGTDETAPYLFEWDSTTFSDGKHTIVAREINEERRDLERQSAPITFTIANNPNDQVATKVEAIAMQTVQDNFASITWDTGENATSQIVYGEPNGPIQTTPLTKTLTDEHTVALTNLEPSTQYTYRVKSIDAAGNETVSSPSSFVTAAESDSTLGSWSAVNNWNYQSVHATVLYTGEVLLWGTSAESRLWNPASGQFTNVNISNNIFCAGHAVFPDGRVFSAGGHINNNVGTKNTNIYNPATKSWTAGPEMRDGRWYPSVIVLGDGRAVMLTGDVTKDRMADIPEVYNPKTNTLTALTSIMTTQLVGYSAIFPFGLDKLYVISYSTADVMLLDATNNTWTNKGKSPIYGGTAAQYRPGKILMSGGRAAGGGSDTKAAITDLNAANPTWEVIAPMRFPRFFHNFVNLPDGRVLVVGGSDRPDTSSPTGPLANEIWDPDTKTWTTVAPLSVRRMYHSTAVLLPDGRVLASGGRNGTGENSSAEIYSPPYLFKGARPTISEVQTNVALGARISVKTLNAANIEKVSILLPASQTHTLDNNQRYQELPFTKESGGLQVQFPSRITDLPLGYYMLFIVNGDGVPSVAKMIKVTDGPIPTPIVTPTQTPTPTPTSTPTPKLTLIPTASPTPTRVPTPTPTLVLSPTPTPTLVPNTTAIALTVGLHGIGRGGDKFSPTSQGNLNPIRTQRIFEVTVTNLNNVVVARVSPTLNYDTQAGLYKGTIALPTVPTGQYIIRVRSANYLGKVLAGTQQITAATLNTISPLSLIGGDTDNDNKITILDYNLIFDCFSDLAGPKNCTPEKKLATDLNDDGVVNQIDYNFFIRELSILAGN